MNERLNFRKTALVFMSLAFLFGAIGERVIDEIYNNGLYFSLPYFIFIILGIGILRIETVSKKILVQPQLEVFHKTLLSFDSIIALFILAFFSFLEIFLVINIIRFSSDYLIKILNPEFKLTLSFSHFLVSLSALSWMLLLYAKLFIDRSRLVWLKGLNILVLIFLLGLTSLLFYKPEYFLEYLNTILIDINIDNQFFLRPTTIWDLKIWQNSAGKSFILIGLGYYLFKCWLSQKNTTNSSIKFGLISLMLLFCVLGSSLVYFYPILLLYATELVYLPGSKLLIVVGAISVSLILILIGLNALTSALFEQNKKIDFSLTFEESKYFTKRNVLITLIFLVGLTSGILFIFVGFKDYFYWIGMIFLLLLVLNFTFQFIASFSFNKISKKFDDRNKENKLSGIDKFLVRLIIPLFLLPLLLVSLPDYFSNFLGNKQLSKKIESLQDLGRITSNHHSLEPYIVRDYNKIILEVDSNKVALDKIDSLKSTQKDSIQLYLENRNYKMNESYRIKKLEYHHDVVFVKNISKWSLIIVSLVIFFLYRYKSSKKI
jgi:hypothetical protein